VAVTSRILLAGAILVAVFTIAASESSAMAGDGWVDELRLGVLDHSADFLNDTVEHGVDINGEVLFHAIDWFTDASRSGWAKVLLTPRPTVGASINTSGGTSAEYLGLTWTVTYASDLFKQGDTLFGDFGFGGAIQDGRVGPGGDPDEIEFGSRGLFHLSGDFGYRFDSHIGLSVYFEHYSNGGLASPNPGLNNIGMRVSYRF
jgi:lipid A 3-O-deacylase